MERMTAPALGITSWTGAICPFCSADPPHPCSVVPSALEASRGLSRTRVPAHRRISFLHAPSRPLQDRLCRPELCGAREGARQRGPEAAAAVPEATVQPDPLGGIHRAP